MSSNNLKTEIPRWWSRRRLLFNKRLLVAVLLALTCYFMLGTKMIEGFEISLHLVLKRLMFGLFFILFANIIYIFGAMLDTRLNWGGIEHLSYLIWNIVFWGCALLPFVMPLLILADKYDLYTPLGL